MNGFLTLEITKTGELFLKLPIVLQGHFISDLTSVSLVEGSSIRKAV